MIVSIVLIAVGLVFLVLTNTFLRLTVAGVPGVPGVPGATTSFTFTRSGNFSFPGGGLGRFNSTTFRGLGRGGAATTTTVLESLAGVGLTSVGLVLEVIALFMSGRSSSA